MTLTSHRILQYIVILLILALSAGGYWYWKNVQAAVTQKAADKTGLVGYWSFDEGSGTSAGDASGNGNTGTLTNGPAWGDGKLGKTLSFDGTNDYVDLGTTSSAFNFSANLSGAAWIKTATDGKIFLSYQNSNPLVYMQVGPTTAGGTANKFVVYLRTNGGGVAVFNSSRSVTDNLWHHVAFVRNTAAQAVYLYVDGTLDASLSYTDTGAIDTSGGGHSVSISNPTYAFPGSIDDVRIYNHVLSASEVTTLYDLGR